MSSDSLPERAAGFFKRVFASWGRDPHRAATTPSGKRLYLYLPTDEGMIPVGTLSRDGEEFVFAYDPKFIRRTDLPPISTFPDKTKEYRSAVLWPVFEVRLPPLGRPDIASRVEAEKIDTHDVLELLAKVGRKTLTTPYEFSLERYSSTGQQPVRS